MYRIFCESYANYIKQNSGDDYRSKMAQPLGLLADPGMYNSEKETETERFKHVSDLLFFMEQNKERFPRFGAFLWTIESRGMSAKHYGIADEKHMLEQARLVNSILKLAYWA